MKSKSRILVVPGAFVPANDTVTLLSYKHLRNIDTGIDVFALKANTDESILRCISKDDKFNKFHVEYFCDYDDAVATFERKNVISAWMNYHRYAKAALKKAIEGDYDVVYTISIPVFTHLAGYYIKKQLKDKIKWIAVFSDPIKNSPYKFDEESYKEYNIVQKVGFQVYIRMFMPNSYEAYAQKYADKVVYIDEEQRDFTTSQYSNTDELKKKAMIVPLNYIEEWDIYQMLQRQSERKNTPKIFSHFGRVYGLRKIDPFLEALKELNKEIPNLETVVQFHQYGQLIDRYVKRIQEYHLENLFHVHEKISYYSALEKMRDSDGLMEFDTILPEDQKQPYLPSKSLEYALLHKSLLVIATSNSPTNRFFTSLGYHVCRYDKEDIKTQLKKMISETDIIPSYEMKQFENQTATKELVQYIESVIRKENV